MSLTDSMTKLFNRRYYNEYFPKLLNIGKRDKKYVAMIMFDVDKFKQYNDNYGHQKGDDALIAIAKTLNECCARGSDVALRLGGEEFAVLLPNTDLDGAMCALTKAMDRVKSLHCHVEDGPVRMPSFSAGVAMYHDGEITGTFIERADQALYRAKSLGRNRVESALH